MNILFISSTNLTTNPRILKEIKLAAELNYNITFVGYKIGGWSDNMDQQIIQEYPQIKFFYLDATRTNFFLWLFNSGIHLIARNIWPLSKGSLHISAISYSKRSIPLLNKLRNLKRERYNIIIAHTLATLYPAYIFGKINKLPFGFDVEDYHPGEQVFGINEKNEKQRREFLLKKTLPFASYITAASPLIAKNIEELIKRSGIVTVLNYFSKNEFIEPENIRSGKIKLVWFSQNINAGRGLELVLYNWKELKNNFELTLIGKLDNGFYESHIKDHQDIIIVDPVPQIDLNNMLSKFDIGLAVDVDDNDYNRQLALTNKILAYFQAGLYIIATNTPAQKNFIHNKPIHGLICDQSPNSFKTTLDKISLIKERIIAEKQLRYSVALNQSWEKESEKIMNKWKLHFN